MLFEERRFALKDGREAVLRAAEPDDAPQMLDYLTTTARETEFVLRYPEECRWTEEQERRLLENFRDNPDSLFLTCFVDSELTGNCELQFNQKIKVRHRASVAIALCKKYWGLGIGTAMFRAMEDVARQRGVRQLELEYIDGNARGKALYEKMGFVRIAEHPEAIRLRDGSFRSLVFMMKKL